MREVTELVLHCSATPNGRKFTVKDIESWHKQRMDWGPSPSGKYIGYHYVIYINGEIAGGRSPEEVGVHAKGHNKNSIGICLIGMNKFTQAQWDALKYLVSSLQVEYPDIAIIGHNEVSHKDCPGFDVQEWLANDMEPSIENILV